jgi:heme A synthase
MLPFGESFAAILAALVLPAFVGLLVISVVGRRAKPRYLAAFSLGIYLWFFSDTIGDASYLYVNEGYAGGLTHALLVLLFAAGLLLLFWADRTTFDTGPSSGRLGFAIPVLVAFAVGFHGLGEGAAFSETAATTLGTNLLAVFGGFSAALAFVLHKALEPMMAGAAYLIYAKEHARRAAQLLRDILVLTLLFSVPGMIGGATDYFLSYDTTYFFAFGLGTSLYAAVRLAKPLFWQEEGITGNESIKIALLIFLGFLLIYLAALFHSS